MKKLKRFKNLYLSDNKGDIKFELEKRIPVWTSISELYLDTELQDNDYTSIANTLTNTDFQLSELKEIDLYEVFPVLKNNLLSVAGVWSGFDQNWLIENCTKAYLKRDNKLFRFKIKVYSLYLYSTRQQHWKEIEQRIKKSD